MHIAAFLLFVPKRYYLWIAVLAIAGYNVLQLFIPVIKLGLGNNQIRRFLDAGRILTKYIFQWLEFHFSLVCLFFAGNVFGKLDWQDKNIQKRVFVTGFFLLAVFKGLRFYIRADLDNPLRNAFYIKYWPQLMEDYFPANIPYLMITTGFALMVISFCMYIGFKFPETNFCCPGENRTDDLITLHHSHDCRRASSGGIDPQNLYRISHTRNARKTNVSFSVRIDLFHL